MGFITGRQFHGFTISRKWLWNDIETDETYFGRRIGNVTRFDPPSQETPTWEDVDRDWDGNLEEAREQ
jgi:hypothetical protein